MANTIGGSLHTAMKEQELLVQNIQQASDPNYSRKISATETLVSDGEVVDVKPGVVTRAADFFRERTIREQKSEASYLEVLATIYNRIEGRLGQPGDDTSLGSRIKSVANKLTALHSEPENHDLVTHFIRELKDTVGYINNMGNFYQSQREQAESSIKQAVDNINGILQELRKVNDSITKVDASDIATYQDLQDKLLKDLSQYVDYNCFYNTDGTVSVDINGGHALLRPQFAATLAFQPVAAIGPLNENSTLGKLYIDGENVTGSIYGGEVGAFFHIRDFVLPNLQAELDEFSVQLRDMINAVHNKGVGKETNSSLTSTRAFNAPGVEVMRMDSAVRIAIMDADNQIVADVLDLDLSDRDYTITEVVTLINNHLVAEGIGTAIIDSGKVVITANDNSHGVAIVSLAAQEAKETTTGLGFSHFFGFNDLLQTGTRYVQDGNPVKAGIAQQLSVNPDILQNYHLLSSGSLSQEVNIDIGDKAIEFGNPEVIHELKSVLDFERIGFADAGAMLHRTDTMVGFANAMWQHTLLDIRNVKDDLDIQQTTLKKTEQELRDNVGVDIEKTYEQFFNLQYLIRALHELRKADYEAKMRLVSIF